MRKSSFTNKHLLLSVTENGDYRPKKKKKKRKIPKSQMVTSQKYLFNIILKNQYENVTDSTLLVTSDHFKPLYSKLTSILDTVL